MMHDDQGDFILEACSGALKAIGPAAVDSIAPRLRDGDVAREIYLVDVLGDIPTESAAQALLARIAELGEVDEMYLSALTNLGSPATVDPLYALWEPGDTLLAESLFMICELNGIKKPEFPAWQRTARSEDDRMSRSCVGRTGSWSPGKDKTVSESPRSETSALPKREVTPGHKSKSASKKARRQRAAQRKSPTGKKHKK